MSAEISPPNIKNGLHNYFLSKFSSIRIDRCSRISEILNLLYPVCGEAAKQALFIMEECNSANFTFEQTLVMDEEEDECNFHLSIYYSNLTKHMARENCDESYRLGGHEEALRLDISFDKDKPPQFNFLWVAPRLPRNHSKYDSEMKGNGGFRGRLSSTLKKARNGYMGPLNEEL